MALAPLLYNITFDSQTRILYFWDKAGHEIYHCEIPSPVYGIPMGGMMSETSSSTYYLPELVYDFSVDNISLIGMVGPMGGMMTVDNIGLMGMIGPMGGMMTEYVPLPTVSSESWVNFTARMEDRYKNIAANEQIDVHVGASFNTVPYDSSLVYAISKIYYNTVIIGHGELQCVDNSGVLAVKNISSSTIRSDGGNYQTCDSTDATVITVYDSSNNPYNAFKYTSNGTDYYYVLDGTQTDWTNDLSGIGYTDQLLIHGWMKADKSSVTLNAGGWTNWQLLNDSGSILYVDKSKTYTLHSPKSGTMKINQSVSGELYYEGTPSETIIVSDVIISVS